MPTANPQVAGAGTAAATIASAETRQPTQQEACAVLSALLTVLAPVVVQEAGHLVSRTVQGDALFR